MRELQGLHIRMAKTAYISAELTDEPDEETERSDRPSGPTDCNKLLERGTRTEVSGYVQVPMQPITSRDGMVVAV